VGLCVAALFSSRSTGLIGKQGLIKVQAKLAETFIVIYWDHLSAAFSQE